MLKHIIEETLNYFFLVGELVKDIPRPWETFFVTA